MVIERGGCDAFAAVLEAACEDGGWVESLAPKYMIPRRQTSSRSEATASAPCAPGHPAAPHRRATKRLSHRGTFIETPGWSTIVSSVGHTGAAPRAGGTASPDTPGSVFGATDALIVASKIGAARVVAGVGAVI